MSELDKDTDEALEDTNSLLKMIGGIRKKEEPLNHEEPAPPPAPEKDMAEAGDFSALLKKLGMAKKEQTPEIVLPPEQPARKTPSGPYSSDELSFSDLDDLLEDVPETRTETIPPAPEPQKPDLQGKDIRASLGKLLNTIATKKTVAQPAPESSQSPSPIVPEMDREEEPVTGITEEDYKAPVRKSPVRQVAPEAPPAFEEEPIIEIYEDDPKAALRKTLAKKGVPVAPPVTEKVTDYEEKIISVDQITDFSGLILPKGATFKIDEINLHGRINAFESTGYRYTPQGICRDLEKGIFNSRF